MRFKRVLIPLLGLASCIDAQAEPITNEVWTIQRFRREFSGEDCWEPFNRTMFGIFDIGMTYVVDPFCYLYSSIIPKPLIKGIDNFSENLESPRRICSNLFMGEWQASWSDTKRCVINSTLGIGGLFDPAEEWFCIFDSNASLSDTFAMWGIPAGPQLALPFLPRATLRGHVGNIADYALDFKTYFDYICPSGIFLGYSWCLTPNKAPVWRGTWESAVGHAEDPYAVYMPVALAMNDFNLRQFAWHYCEDQVDCAYLRVQAKEFPEGSAERTALEAEAAACVSDVRPPVHPSAAKPSGLKGRWREIPGYAPRHPALDSLRALCFSPVGDNDFWWERRSIFNRDFSKSIEAREITIREDLPRAVYSFVAADDSPNPQDDACSMKHTPRLAFVLPGLGAGRTASEAVAMAELLHGAGYAVVICDSQFHPEHVRSVNRGILPGYISEDTIRFADYLERILADLTQAGRVSDPDIHLVGWSMGGLSVAHMAALDAQARLPIRVSRFVAINPPASMEHALAPFDAVMEGSRSWSKEYAHEMFVRAAPSLQGWAAQEHPRYDPANPPKDAIDDLWDYAPNLTGEQADYLLGMTLRVIFPQLVEQRHRRAPFPWLKSEWSWFSRRALEREIGDVSMRTYITRYVPACYDGVTADQMIATADFWRLGDDLKRNERFAVLHTWDDPLETDDDRRCFDQLLGERITWFAVGGHCGYFYTQPFKDELLRRLACL